MIELEYISANDQDIFVPAVVDLSKRLISNPYLTVGAYFKNLQPRPLEQLVMLVNATCDEDGQTLSVYDEDATTNLLALTQLLAHAEGVTHSSDNEVCEALVSCVSFIIIADLGHKDAINVIWENMSLARDMEDVAICSKKD